MARKGLKKQLIIVNENEEKEAFFIFPQQKKPSAEGRKFFNLR